MATSDELARLGEPPVTPDEEAEALRTDSELEQGRRGEPATPGIDPHLARTIAWTRDHVVRSRRRADAWELEELGRVFPQFEPVALLGRGGEGDVYLVKHAAM